MRVEVRGQEKEKFCEAQRLIVSELVGRIESIDISKNSLVPSSRQYKNQFSLILQSQNWLRNFKYDSSVPDSINNANYKLDAVLDENCLECSCRHRFLLEVCFDNRQAIGTNLMKFETASQIFQSKPNQTSISILICADARTLKKLGWDPATGSSEEYEFALRDPYVHILKTEPILLVLRS